MLERHAHRLESVEAPRQRLEELFINIVERARTENVATSGADNAGQTAAFLKGDGAAGDELIESLVSAATEPEVEAVPMETTPAPRPEAVTERVIDDLLSDAQEEKPAPAPEQASRREASEKREEAPAPPKSVDDDVISSLLSDNDE